MSLEIPSRLQNGPSSKSQEPQEPVEAASRVVASPGAVAKFFWRGVGVFWFAPGTGC